MDTLKCKVIMLPHNQKAALYKGVDVLGYGASLASNREVDADSEWQRFGTPQHLYFTSNRKIQTGDCYINEFEGKQKLYRNSSDLLYDGQNSKVEATTDPELYVKYPMEAAGHFLNIPLPLIPQSFVEKYVQQQGKIKEVLVEVYDHAALFLGYETGDVKTRPDGTCIIHKVKDNWNQKELKEACWMAYCQGLAVEKYGSYDWEEIFEKWFNENF